MNLEFNPEGLCLKPKQLLKVRSGVGHTIVCHSGSVWLTQDRDRRDIVLDAGESFALDRDGLVLVQALEQSTISIAARLPGAQARAALQRHTAVAASLVHGAARA